MAGTCFATIDTNNTTPVIDPAPLFKNYPWTFTDNMWWRDWEKTNQVVWQLWKNLQYRGLVSGNSYYPHYENVCRLDCMNVTTSITTVVTTNIVINSSVWPWTTNNVVKTNYVIKYNNPATFTNSYFTNWWYWGSDTNITNSMREYRPSLQLYMETNLFNGITNFVYGYPQNCAQDYSGLYYRTSVVAITKQMLDGIIQGIEQVAPNFVPASLDLTTITNIDESSPFPHYCMAGLLIDAGIGSLCSNLVLTNNNTWVYSGDWQLEQPLYTTNGCANPKGFRDAAKMIAQLKKVYSQGQACTPCIDITGSNHKDIRESNPWDGMEYFSYTNEIPNVIFGINDMPHAWRETSTDYEWATNSFGVDGTWSDDVGYGETYISYSMGGQSDWPLSGSFPGVADIDLTFKVHFRYLFDDPTSTTWTKSDFGGLHWFAESIQGFFDDTTTPPPDLTINQSVAVHAGEVGSWPINCQLESIHWTTSNYQYSTYLTTNISYTDTSSYVTLTNTITRYLTNNVEDTNGMVITGTYTDYSNVVNYMTWTNLQHYTNYFLYPSNFITGYSNVNSYGTFTNIDIESHQGDEYWQVDDHFTIVSNAANSGTITIADNQTWNELHTLVHVPTIRTSVHLPVYYFGIACTATLYVAGSGDNRYKPNNLDWYTNSVWDFSDTNETKLTEGLIIDQNKWSPVKIMNVSEMTNDGNGIGVLYWTNMFKTVISNDMFGNSHYYYPFIEVPTAPGYAARVGWAIGHAAWIIDYNFPTNN